MDKNNCLVIKNIEKFNILSNHISLDINYWSVNVF